MPSNASLVPAATPTAGPAARQRGWRFRWLGQHPVDPFDHGVARLVDASQFDYRVDRSTNVLLASQHRSRAALLTRADDRICTPPTPGPDRIPHHLGGSTMMPRPPVLRPGGAHAC